MDIDLSAAAAFLAQPPSSPDLLGVPRRDLLRSPAAAAIGRLAHASGLFLFHYEHRAHLALPLDQVPEHAPGAADPPDWAQGVLPERKYQSFRHDQAQGSFHPGHRGKWSTHELCHGLVGFSSRPDATALYHATAGRLAELLPVALYYFFDEVHLARCPDHQRTGPLFKHFCPACEDLAGLDRDDVDAAERVEAGLRYIEAELEAVDRTLHTGRPVPHRHASLELCSDGLAYERAHRQRLASPMFARWVEAFTRGGGLRRDDLGALRDRLIEVCDGLLTGAAVAPLAPSPELGQARWMAQDLAWRMLLVHSECEGPAADGLDGIVNRLADATAATWRTDGDAEAVLRGLGEAAEAYRALDAEYELLPASELLALGYRLPGLEPDPAIIAEGVASAAPLSLARGDIAGFASYDLDHPERRPLAERWARWLSGPVGELARFEVAPLRARSGLDLGLGDGDVQLCEGVVLEDFDHDVADWAAALRSGDAVPILRPHTGAFVKEPSGEILCLELPRELGAQLATLTEPTPSPFEPEVSRELIELGILRPASWALTR